MSESFVHLKVHSEYSLVDGIVRIEDLIARARELAMPAVAITDRVNLFSLVKFYKEAMSHGIKPIVGCDLLLRENKSCFLLTALCNNQAGLANLRELISKAYLEGQVNDIPMISWEWLHAARNGLIILSGGRQGDVGKALLSNDRALAEKRMVRWKTSFPNQFYLELQRTGRDGEENYIQGAVALAKQLSIPVVATNDVRFMHAEDFDAHEARVCIQSSQVLSDPKRPKYYSDQQYFKSAEEMRQLFLDIPSAIQNAAEIAKRCTVTLTLGKIFMPQFPLPKEVSLENYIREKSVLGLHEHFSHHPEIDAKKNAYETRLKTELSVIHSMGFSGYFLIVADFIRWSKENNIPVGPGRGSGAGSLVAFCLGITGLDPIEHELLFERFLNPERVSLPDFDIDFCMDNRDRVIDYVANRYGRDSVSQIITYGTMAARAVVRDVGRVLGFPYGFVDTIAKLIPFEIGMTLEKALIQEADLKKRYDNEDEVGTLINLAKKLEGLARNAGKHAGGVVIAPTKLTDFAPLYCEAGSTHIVTQFDKDDVEAVGLVKFDFLGLRTLTIIQWAVNSINARLNAQSRQGDARVSELVQAQSQQGDARVSKRVILDINKIPLNDEKTFTLLKNCMTTAVFQLESRGMKDLVRRLQPDCFEDITALVALFRPGPLQSGMVDDFINRKHGREKVHYFHADIEPILKPTYGVILYQEQVMQIAQVLAGYSLGSADILRRAMGKKKPEEMAEQREIFISGAKKRGVNERIAITIFDLMEKFAGYGFNKSHSAAYALLAYQTAYLKAHYPAEFMAAVLSSDMDNTDKVVSFYHECEAMQLTVLSPNINYCDYPFTVNARTEIVYGLGAIKGVGEAAAKLITSERQKNGMYCDLFDFCARLNAHTVSRRTIEPLIRSGAMDDFKVSRVTLLASIDKAIKAADQQHQREFAGQVDLFGACDDNVRDPVEYVSVTHEDAMQKLDGEKETLGHYLSGHPIKIYEREIAHLTTCTLHQLSEHMGKTVTVAGLLVNVKRIFTKQGKRMAVITMEDRSGLVEMTLFSKVYDAVSTLLEKNQVYIVQGKVEEDSFNQSVRILVESITHLDEKRKNLAKKLVILVKDEQHANQLLEALPPVMAPFRGGECPVQLMYSSQQANAKAKLNVGSEWRVTPKNALLAQLKQLCGEECVKVGY